MYDENQVRDILIRAATGQRPGEEWLRDIEDASPIEGEDGTFGLAVNGQNFFVSVESA